MKTKTILVLAALTAIITGSLQKAAAQNTAPFWSLAGNSGTNPPAQFLGTTDNKFLVFKTQGLTRMLIGQGGNVGIGTGTTSPAGKLQISGGTNAGLSGGGYAVIGAITSQNVAIDVNGIMSRSNGAASALYLNEYGGNVYIDRNNTGSRLGIGTTAPAAKLHVNSTTTGREVARFDGANQAFISIYENGVNRGYFGTYAGNAEDVDFGTPSTSSGKVHLTIQTIPALTADLN